MRDPRSTFAISSTVFFVLEGKLRLRSVRLLFVCASALAMLIGTEFEMGFSSKKTTFVAKEFFALSTQLTDLTFRLML